MVSAGLDGGRTIIMIKTKGHMKYLKYSHLLSLNKVHKVVEYSFLLSLK